MAHGRRLKLATLRALALALGLPAAVLTTWAAQTPQRLAAHPDQTAAVEELLRAARLWHSLGGADEERNLLRKLLSVSEDEPRALFMLAQLEWREGHPEEAQRAFALLRGAGHNRGAAVGVLRARLLADLRAMSRVYETERDRLAQLRMLIRGGGGPRAHALARALFPDGRPPGDLANEFADALAVTPSGWTAMRELFRRRLQADPGNGPDALSYYRLLAQHEETRPQALAGLEGLARASDVDARRVQEAWRDALDYLGHDEASQRARRRFLERYPADETMLAQYRQAAARAAAAAQVPQPALGRSEGEPESAQDPVSQGLLAAQRELDADRPEAALALLAEVRRIEPNQPEAIGLEGLVAFRRGQYGPALQAFRSALVAESGDEAHAARWRDLIPAAQFWGALAAARKALESGDLAQALVRVAEARQIQPDQPQALLLQADILARHGDTDAARDLYRQRLKAEPADASAWRGLLALILARDGAPAALDEAERARAQGLDAAALLDAGAIRAVIRAQTANHPDAALRLLEQAVALNPDDPWLRFELARHYADLGLPDSAAEVMAQGVARKPADPDMIHAAALVATAADRYADALALLASLPSAQWSPGMSELARRAQFEAALAQAKARRGTDASAEGAARARARELAGDDPSRWLRVIAADVAADDRIGAQSDVDALRRAVPTLDASERLRLAGLLVEAGRGDDALTELDRLQGMATADRETMLPWWMVRARAHRAAGDAIAFAADLKALDGMLAPDEVGPRLDVIDLMGADDAQARDWLARLRAAKPQDPRVVFALAAQAHRHDHDNLAMALLESLNATSLPVPLLERTQALRDRIRAEQKTWVEAAWEHDTRQASPGTSSLSLLQVPVRMVWPHDYESQYFVQVDALRLDAGVLPATLGATAAWGSLLVHPIGPDGLAAPLDIAANGLSLEAGVSAAQRRWDLGVSGAGLPVPNLVGGWRESWGLAGDATLSVQGSRRALTGSLLAFAGARDPASGQTWGGAVDNALNLRWARDLPDRWTVSTALLLGDVTGRHLPSNVHEESRSVVDRDWVSRPDFRLNAGAVVSLWHYARNESFFTLGQGGYYSPQRYLSLGLPIEATGRVAGWSYLLRLTPSRSSTTEQASPAYPIDAGLQALSGNALLGGSQGGGWALSARADLEYRVGQHGAVGAWLDLDRSSYYAPTRMMFYLRYQIDPPLLGPVLFAPRAVTPISRF